ncbi:MAG: hypothetical protein WCO26_19370, partial [Deltaproteobacteria bacterium]
NEKSGNQILLGAAFYNQWYENLENLGIKCQGRDCTFPIEGVNVTERLTRITSGKHKDLYMDSQGNVIVPGIKLLRREFIN